MYYQNFIIKLITFSFKIQLYYIHNFHMKSFKMQSVVTLKPMPFEFGLSWFCNYQEISLSSNILGTLKPMPFGFGPFVILQLSRNFFVIKYFPLTAMFSYLTYWVFYIAYIKKMSYIELNRSKCSTVKLWEAEVLLTKLSTVP